MRSARSATAETADIAVKSAPPAISASTVHANDAPGTVTRLVDMGVPRHLVGRRWCW
jgi:type IV pilus assembly protein PilB